MSRHGDVGVMRPARASGREHYESECMDEHKSDVSVRMYEHAFDVQNPYVNVERPVNVDNENTAGPSMNIGVQMRVSVDVRVLCSQVHVAISDMV
jgi:hypothetical protein